MSRDLTHICHSTNGLTWAEMQAGGTGCWASGSRWASWRRASSAPLDSSKRVIARAAPHPKLLVRLRCQRLHVHKTCMSSIYGNLARFQATGWPHGAGLPAPFGFFQARHRTRSPSPKAAGESALPDISYTLSCMSFTHGSFTRLRQQVGLMAQGFQRSLDSSKRVIARAAPHPKLLVSLRCREFQITYPACSHR